MIFIKLDKIDETKAKVQMVHNMPFDEVDGMGMNVAELEQIGVLVESVVEPIQQEGKMPVMYYSYTDKKVFYEYVDRPKTQEEQIKELNDKINLMLKIQLESEGVV